MGTARREAALALLMAWAVQAVGFALVGRALDRNAEATTAWLGGIALRAGTLLLAFVATRLDIASHDAAVTYGLGLTTLLILEAAWLALGRTGSNDR